MALLDGARDPEALEALIDLGEQVLRTWQPAWSGFLSAPLREEALDRLTGLSDLQWHSDGGYPGAERQRLLCRRADDASEHPSTHQGLLIEGNFLFDPLTPKDLHQALLSMGVADADLGDLWVRGDRGGQGICTAHAAAILRGRRGAVRDVEIHCDILSLSQLQLPAQRVVRTLQTVEASCRLDAIASAGFGLSRAKVVAHVKAGRLRLNWGEVRQPSRDVSVGDRLQLQDRGCVEVLSLTLTKRDRWRVELRRS